MANAVVEKNESQKKPDPRTGDVADISDEARELAATHYAERGGADKKDLGETVRSLLEKLNNATADINKHIGAVLEKNGIKLSADDKLRVEVDAAGRIFVGGIKETNKIKAIEDALNKEAGLSQKIREYKNDFKKTSRILREETGKTLDKLIDETSGNIDRRRQKLDSEGRGVNQDDYYYQTLQYLDLFSQAPELHNLVKNLSPGNNMVGISTELTLANPENALRDIIKEAYARIESEFGDYNDRLLEKIPRGDSSLKDPDFNRNFLLNIGTLRVTMTSAGGMDIEVGGDRRTAAKGREIAEKVLTEMLAKIDDAGQASIFDTASQRLIQNYLVDGGDAAAADIQVELTMGGEGGMGKVRVVSAAREAELKNGVKQEVGVLLRDMGVKTSEAMEIEVKEDGRLRLANPDPNSPQYQDVMAALESINERLGRDSDDKDLLPLKERLKEYEAYKKGGLAALGEPGIKQKDAGGG
ncbi:MAG: hypothetical protein LBV15_05765, partial [Planctomycetota bacterium]|nr:hypothetical protein [Planctomycetota bacterium]